jgi:hypothetical protein
MFKEVRDPCDARALIAGADVIPDLDSHQWHGVIFEEQDLKAILQPKLMNV